jgi:hypothetical protein
LLATSISNTISKLVEKFAAGVVDTGGNFAADVVDAGGNLSPVSLIQVQSLWNTLGLGGN